MKKNLLLVLCLCLSLTAFAGQSDTLFVADYGIHPYSYENQTERMRKLIEDCKTSGARVIAFGKGRYDFWTDGAVRKDYFISNTSSEEECPSKTKTFGLYLEDINGLTIDGNGAELVFHGKMTMIAVAHCRQICLKNISFDFERPSTTELTYTKHDEKGVEVRFHKDARYEIENGRIHIYGEGWRSNNIHCVEYNPQNLRSTYSDGWYRLAESKAEEIETGVVRFATAPEFCPQIGNTLTIRDIYRDQVGMFLYESQDITLSDVNIHYMHGLGIVSQYSRNINMHRVHCTPKEGSGRILASSADFMHFSGCSGKINIMDCRFEGSQDDPINVHGTNLRATRKIDEQTLELRFMHAQSYGFNAFFAGDTVAFVKASTMERISRARVSEVIRLSDRTLAVKFDRTVPKNIELGHDCVENLSCTPEVEIRNCFFTRTNTRGTLVTTPRKVVISGNTYLKTGMSAILIESDAEGWYESGPVNDVLIENNTFIDCGYTGGPGNAVIAMHPSNTIISEKHPVHRNIRITGNTFVTWGNPLLYAKSTEDLVFSGNEIQFLPDISPKTQFILHGCSKVKIRNNRFPIDYHGKNNIIKD